MKTEIIQQDLNPVQAKPEPFWGDQERLLLLLIPSQAAWAVTQASFRKAAFLKVQPNLHHKTPADKPRHWVPSAVTFSWLLCEQRWCWRRVNHPRSSHAAENELLWKMGTAGLAPEHIPLLHHRDTSVSQGRPFQSQLSALAWLIPGACIPPSRHEHGEQSPGISPSRALSAGDKAAGPDTPLHESKRCQSLKVLWQKASSL